MRKYMIAFCLIFITLAFCLSANVPSVEKNFLIYLDPGHGGIDGGASFAGVKESDLNLMIAKKLEEILVNYGFDVLLTRNDDCDLASDPRNRKRSDIKKRVELINKSSCDMFISLHMNSFSDDKYRGAQVFYDTTNEKNILLASFIQDTLVSYLKNTDREAKRIRNIYLLEKTSKVGCLIECGFLSNNDEFKLLTTPEYQTKVAYAIFYGIQNFLVFN